MKKKQLLAFLILAVYFVTMCGFFGTKKYIRAGDKEMEKGNYKNAIEQYKKAGEDAEDKLTEACIRVYGRCFTTDNYEKDRYIDAYTTLKEELKSVKTSQEIDELVMEKLTEKLDKTNQKLKSKQEELDILDYGNFMTDCDEMLKVLEKMDSATTSYEKLSDSIYTTKANIGLARLKLQSSKKSSKEDQEEAKFAWSKIGEGKNTSTELSELLENLANSSTGLGKTITENIENFRAGEYETAAKSIMDAVEDEAVALEILNSIEVEKISTDLNELLKYTNVMRKLTSKEIPEKLSDMLKEERGIFIELKEHAKSTNLTAEHKKQLQKLAGTKPEGKILIIHNRNDWEDHVDLYHELMNELPDQYYPESLESVEYIIELKYESELVGKYSDGSSAIRPDGVLTVYSAPGWNKLYTVTQTGSTRAYAIGDQDTSIEPDMYADVITALEKIETTMNKTK